MIYINQRYSINPKPTFIKKCRSLASKKKTCETCGNYSNRIAKRKVLVRHF